jgi:hypothetical protein
MNVRVVWSRILVVAGAIAMLVGAIDPLEGSFVILPGCAFVTLGTFLGNNERRMRTDWLWVLGSIAFGVGAMIVLSAFGGIGGKSGHSLWWGLLILPYPIGWTMGIVSLASRLIKRVQLKHAARGIEMSRSS